MSDAAECSSSKTFFRDTQHHSLSHEERQQKGEVERRISERKHMQRDTNKRKEKKVQAIRCGGEWACEEVKGMCDSNASSGKERGRERSKEGEKK